MNAPTSAEGGAKQPGLVSRLLLKVLGPAEVQPAMMEDSASQQEAPAQDQRTPPAVGGP